MKKADSIHDLARKEEIEAIENKGDDERASILRSFSEHLPLFESESDVLNAPPKAKKLKSFRSRLSFRIRTLKDSRIKSRKTSSIDALESKSREPSVDDLTSESGSKDTQVCGQVVKKKKKLSKKLALIGFKWPKLKSADDNAITTATQTSPPPVQEDTCAKLAALQLNVDPHAEKIRDCPAISEQIQKLQIKISGRKTEYKNPSAMKGANELSSKIDNLEQNEESNKFNITQSERDTPPMERAPSRPLQPISNNVSSTAASVESSPLESMARLKGAVRKSPRLERQVSGEEYFDEDKSQIMLPDIPQERGSRFPRPTSSSVLPKPARVERLNRVQDYINETFVQNDLGEPNTNSNIDLAETKRLSRTPSLRDIRDNKDSYIFHSANSTDSNDSPISDAGRRRIKYVGQPTFYTDEEKEILEGKRQAFRNLSGISEYSFESDYPSESQMPAFGDLVMDPEEAQIMTSGTEKREHLYKILVIGELGAGKTSFIKRYVHQFFSANYRATIGVDFALKVLHWDQNTIVRLQLWDIAGQERFGNMTRVYYKEAVGAFIVFDVTRSGTFDAVSKWKEDLDSKVQLPGGGSIPCILLANKCDQEKQGLVTNPEKMDEYVKENGFSGWFETSAKENINIEEAARALVSQILLNDKLITAADIIDNDKFALGNTSGQVTSAVKKNCSC